MSFIKINVSESKALYSLSKTRIAVFLELANIMDEYNLATATIFKKEEIAKSINVELTTVNEAIKFLYKTSVMDKVGRSVYKLNSSIVKK